MEEKEEEGEGEGKTSCFPLGRMTDCTGKDELMSLN